MGVRIVLTWPRNSIEGEHEPSWLRRRDGLVILFTTTAREAEALPLTIVPCLTAQGMILTDSSVRGAMSCVSATRTCWCVVDDTENVDISLDSLNQSCTLTDTGRLGLRLLTRWRTRSRPGSSVVVYVTSTSMRYARKDIRARSNERE